MARAKGGTTTPFAARDDRPIAGVDAAEKGGSYQSYHFMMGHRTKHVRSVHGPFERYSSSPTMSWENGFFEHNTQNVRPPTYPLSTTVISKSAEDIIKTTGGRKGR
mmetsp:Transcript_23408/g.53554  ORF Transcript_23408/g.53554 Transcript_23408/m.53554 type:complete len:106 (-) Transcript_23408:201-518(-)